MRSERGDTKLGCILYLLAAFYVIWLAIVMVPVFQANLELKDEMGQIASSYSYFRGNKNKAVEAVLKKAQELELPIQKRDIRIVQRKNMVEITITYKRTLNLLFMKKEMTLKPTVNKPTYGINR